MGGSEEENPIWSALKEPLSSFVGGQQISRSNSSVERAAKKEDAERKRYQKRIQSLQMEVEEVNEQATNTRKMLWEAQDKLKESEEQIRKLENHLNEILELREKDLQSIKDLRVANSDCVENESRAREAMEVFKKCYKRAQVKIKEHEEEIGVLREQRESSGRGNHAVKNFDTSGMVNESALEYVQTVSRDKEKRLKKMLSETEVEVDLWKSKYKVANKRCMNWQEQMLAMEHPSEGAAHIKRQRIEIEKLQGQIKEMKEKENEAKEPDCRNPFESMPEISFFGDGGLREVMDGIQNLNCSGPKIEI